MTNRKYRLESYHFTEFRRYVKNFPPGEVWHEDSPDFLIHSENGVIGVEHCLVQIPTRQRMPLQAIESQTDEIVSIAQEHAALRGMPPIHATFNFGHIVHMEKKERIRLGRDIARIIYDKLSELDITKPLTSLIIRYPEVPRQLSSVHIIIPKKDSRHFWNCARAGWAMESCIDVFQETILKKERHLGTYIEKCEKCWLLMVAEAKPSGFIHPNQQSANHIFRSSFERIYFFDMSQRQLYALNTAAI